MRPEWFEQAIAFTPRSENFYLADHMCHYLHWSNPGKPGLVLVHGHAAHAHWWDFIAPSFTDDFDVVAIDLLGSGDSAHAGTYSVKLFAEQIVSAARHANLVDPVLAGHSFGGAMSRSTCYLHPGVFSQLLLIDSLIPAKKGNRQPPPMPTNRERFYPTREEGMRRFRLRPPQPRPAQYIIDHIAAHSLKETEKGWQFKLDAAVFSKMPPDLDLPAGPEMIQALEIPVKCIYGELSRFFPGEAVKWTGELLGKENVEGVADAYHHVFLDQPVPFIDTLIRMVAHRHQS